MGTKGRAIIGLDVDELLKLLNKAFADEWLAYYQYWVGAKVAKGPMKDAIIAELIQHATEELGHATLVSDRIIQLGGTPLTSPKVWFDWTNCGYEPPDNPFVRTLLEQNIKAEQCAIDVYDKLMKLTEGKDPITYNIALTILEQEVEHEEDLQALLEDLDLMISPPR
ncbi:ferritin-like domain-containing protein [Trichloromonas sp.]|uniref:ferritin-like domain-containing protein n=1 Tax=Trichloromonas sp. TaxID=3069249 RepID=UPI002A4368B2|nr:ferritin-like domain-containing protein [Trichloromonas sp.]